jgi:hypothetical protein
MKKTKFVILLLVTVSMAVGYSKPFLTLEKAFKTRKSHQVDTINTRVQDVSELYSGNPTFKSGQELWRDFPSQRNMVSPDMVEIINIERA